MSSSVSANRARLFFQPDGAGPDPSDLACCSVRPEPTSPGGPAEIARVTLEVLEPAQATDLLRVGVTGRLTAAIGELSHDYGRLRVAYNHPSIAINECVAWTIILEPEPIDPPPIPKDTQGLMAAAGVRPSDTHGAAYARSGEANVAAEILKDPGRGMRGKLNAVEGEVPAE